MLNLALTRSELKIDDAFADAVLSGLAGRPRSLPCRFLYDARGSDLFERITELPEYYPTRTEIALLDRHAREIASLAGKGAALIELGSGSSRKTRRLIDSLEDIRTYVPIDISRSALDDAASALSAAYPWLTILPIHADFDDAIDLPDEIAGAPRLGFFPGSTIGNLDRRAAIGFLARAASLLGAGAHFLVGVDLEKDPRMLTRAYNDSAGVTAAFNLNLLTRINRELGGDFDLSRFAHEAVYNERLGRMELYLVSQADQIVNVLGETFAFAKGERIHTENSHKYAVGEFQDLARGAGWRPIEAWVDPRNLFSLHYLQTD